MHQFWQNLSLEQKKHVDNREWEGSQEKGMTFLQLPAVCPFHYRIKTATPDCCTYEVI